MNLTTKLRAVLIITICTLLSFSTSALADLVLADGGPTGQWADHDRSGEGFYVEIIRNDSGNRIGIAYFGFDQNGNAIWASGDVFIDDNDTVVEMQLFQFAGPEWGPGFDEADRIDTVFGSLNARWPNCDNAYITIAPQDAALERWNFPMTRLTSIEGLNCTNPPPPAPEDGVAPGQWSGPGVCFNVSPEGDTITSTGSTCDDGQAFAASLAGETSLGETCNVDMSCDGVWEIIEGKELRCVDALAGELALGTFDSETLATGTVYQTLEGIAGNVCFAVWTATAD
jgi:hypothetical protein